MTEQTTGLWKTTIHIWTDFDPQNCDLARLAEEADVGDGYCDYRHSEYIPEPLSFSPAAVDFFYPEDGG